jgi:uracil-DNA glycosylase
MLLMPLAEGRLESVEIIRVKDENRNAEAFVGLKGARLKKLALKAETEAKWNITPVLRNRKRIALPIYSKR